MNQKSIESLSALLLDPVSLGRDPSLLTHDLGMWMRQHGFDVMRLLRASAARDAWLQGRCEGGSRDICHESGTDGGEWHRICFAEEKPGQLINGMQSTEHSLPAQTGCEKSYLDAIEAALGQVR